MSNSAKLLVEPGKPNPLLAGDPPDTAPHASQKAAKSRIKPQDMGLPLPIMQADPGDARTKHHKPPDQARHPRSHTDTVAG